MTGIKPDRRQVVRAGVWTVPAIAVAATAPAFAASGADLSTSTGTISSPQKSIRASLTIINTGNAATCGLTVRVNSPNAVSANQVAPTGFVVTTVGSNFVIFTAIASNQVAAKSTLQPNPTVFVVERGNNGSGGVTVQIDPGCGGTPGLVSGSAA